MRHERDLREHLGPHASTGRGGQSGSLAHWLRSNTRKRFLLMAAPLRLPGAVGSPTTPVATV